MFAIRRCQFALARKPRLADARSIRFHAYSWAAVLFVSIPIACGVDPAVPPGPGQSTASQQGGRDSTASAKPLRKMIPPPADPIDLEGQATASGYLPRPLDAVAVSPDGKWIAAGGGSLHGRYSEVHLWNAITLEKVAALSGHDFPVNALAFSPNGSTLASGSHDNRAILWQVEGAEPKQRAVLPGHGGPVTSVAFSPDGTWLAVGVWGPSLRGWVRLWDVSKDQPVDPLKLPDLKNAVRSVLFLPETEELVSGSEDGTVRIWRLSADGAEVQRTFSFKPDAQPRHRDSLNCLVASPKGDRLAGGTARGEVHIWNLGNAGEHPATALKEHEKSIKSIAFSLDGTILVAAGEDGTIACWDVATGRKLAKKSFLPQIANSIAFSGDGRQLISANTVHDPKNGIVVKQGMLSVIQVWPKPSLRR